MNVGITTMKIGRDVVNDNNENDEKTGRILSLDTLHSVPPIAPCQLLIVVVDSKFKRRTMRIN